MEIFGRAFHDAKHTFKQAGQAIKKKEQKIVKPMYVASTTALGSVYNHAVKPIAHDAKKATQFVVDKTAKFGKKGEQFLSAEADLVVNTNKSLATAVGGLGNFATNVETGVGGFLGNSWSYVIIGGGVLAALVFLRR